MNDRLEPAPAGGIDYLAHITADLAAICAAVHRGPAGAVIAGCPGWTLAELARHVGTVQRWARLAVVTGQRPVLDEAADPAPADPDDLDGLAMWLRAGGERLLADLGGLDPESPTWHPFPAPKVAGLWPRRQAQELAVHRWDAERAVGVAGPIEKALAADGIDEYFTVMLPRLASREHLATPTDVVAFEATDAGRRWVVTTLDGVPSVLPEPARSVATVAAVSETLLLRLWGRPGEVAVSGDDAAAAAWLSLGGA